MSRKGDCWDNAPMESFWGTLKNELVHHRRYRTQMQAIQEITEYIEIFYNRQRKQARLGYLSPAAFTQRYYEKQLVAQPVGLHYCQPTSMVAGSTLADDMPLLAKQSKCSGCHLIDKK